MEKPYQYELKINNQTLQAELKSLYGDNTNRIKSIDINNDIFKKLVDIKIDKCLQVFLSLYNKFKKINLMSLKELLLIAFKSEYPSIRIPLDEINIDFDFTIYDIDIEKFLKNKHDTYTVYYCNNNCDLILACVFYYLQYGYRLKKCPICKNWFIENKNVKQKFCDEKCRKKSNSIRSLQNRNNNPIAKVLKKIVDMLQSRDTNELQKFYAEYQQIRDKLSKDELLKWLQNKHQELKKG